MIELPTRINKRLVIENGIKTETWQCEDCMKFVAPADTVLVDGVFTDHKGRKTQVRSCICATCDSAFPSG